MDYNKIREVKAKSENLTSRMYLLEEMHKETMEKINEIQNICNHEFIFINHKYENLSYNYLQYGKCLVCGKSIILTPENINIGTNEMISIDNIIDVVDDKIEKCSDDCDCSLTKDKLEEAQKAFDSLITTFGDRLFIKQSIINSINEVNLYNKKK